MINKKTIKMKNESKSLIRKERLNYVVENGHYVGYLVNLPIAVQSESYEEMILDAKELAKAWLAVLQQVLEQDEPFDVVEN
jgi:predicted RNase H-like HicB family nuclease